jgi:hypothetical protein
MPSVSGSSNKIGSVPQSLKVPARSTNSVDGLNWLKATCWFMFTLKSTEVDWAIAEKHSRRDNPKTLNVIGKKCLNFVKVAFISKGYTQLIKIQLKIVD